MPCISKGRARRQHRVSMSPRDPGLAGQGPFPLRAPTQLHPSTSQFIKKGRPGLITDGAGPWAPLSASNPTAPSPKERPSHLTISNPNARGVGMVDDARPLIDNGSIRSHLISPSPSRLQPVLDLGPTVHPTGSVDAARGSTSK